MNSKNPLIIIMNLKHQIRNFIIYAFYVCTITGMYTRITNAHCDFVKWNDRKGRFYAKLGIDLLPPKRPRFIAGVHQFPRTSLKEYNEPIFYKLSTDNRFRR